MVLRKKVLAVVLTGAMVLGSSLTAFAEDATSATGTGANTGHLDTNIVEAVLPTTESVANVFNFTIDPENILADADKYTDGTAWDTENANADLVYFKQSNNSFDSKSQEIEVKAQNYIDADISVEVEIAEADEGKTIIPMASTAQEYTDSEGAILLLTLKVGDSTGIVTPEGVTVADTLDAQADKFETKYEDNKYVLKPKASQTWDGKKVQLIGKVKTGIVEENVVAPNVTLTWTVAAHVDAPAPSASMSTTVKSVTINNLPTGATLESVKVVKADDSEITLTATTQYTYTEATNTFAIVEGKEVLLDNTKYKKYILNYSGDVSVEIPIVAAD